MVEISCNGDDYSDFPEEFRSGIRYGDYKRYPDDSILFNKEITIPSLTDIEGCDIKGKEFILKNIILSKDGKLKPFVSLTENSYETDYFEKNGVCINANKYTIFDKVPIRPIFYVENRTGEAFKKNDVLLVRKLAWTVLEDNKLLFPYPLLFPYCTTKQLLSLAESFYVNNGNIDWSFANKMKPLNEYTCGDPYYELTERACQFIFMRSLFHSLIDDVRQLVVGV